MKIGIIGGSGISQSRIFPAGRYIEMQTPFGKPSDTVAVGRLESTKIFFIPRHGWKHTIDPSEVNYRANIWTLKALGCTHVIGTTACCSLNDNVKPGNLMMLSSFINRTTHREGSFYNGELGVAHIPMQPSFCEKMNKLFYYASQSENYTCHRSGLIVTVEGPHFPSITESAPYHDIGADVINMTTVPEVCLAKELSLLYSCIASVTDYCHWNDLRKSLTKESVVKIFHENGIKVTDLIKKTLSWIECESWDEEIKLLEETVQKSKYKKEIPTWDGPYYPPWIAAKTTAMNDNIHAGQKPLHTDIVEPYIMNSSYPSKIDQSNFALPVKPEASSYDIDRLTPNLTDASEVTSMNIPTPSFNKNIYPFESKPTPFLKITQHPAMSYSENAMMPDELSTKPISADPLRQSSVYHSVPHTPFPKEIDIDILPISTVIFPPPKLVPPPSDTLHSKQSFTLSPQMITHTSQHALSIHRPPTVVTLPSHILNSKQLFMLPTETVMDAPTASGLQDSELNCLNQTLESKFVIQPQSIVNETPKSFPFSPSVFNKPSIHTDTPLTDNPLKVCDPPPTVHDATLISTNAHSVLLDSSRIDDSITDDIQPQSDHIGSKLIDHT